MRLLAHALSHARVHMPSAVHMRMSMQYTCGTFSESRSRDSVSSGYESFEPSPEPGLSVHCIIIRRCDALASPLSGWW